MAKKLKTNFVLFVPVVLLMMGCYGSDHNFLYGETAQWDPSEAEIVANVPSTQFSVVEMLKTEWKDLDPRIIRVLKIADRMTRRHVGYHGDKNFGKKLTQNDLYYIHHHVRQLSCSEFVWYAFAISNFPMGITHIETKDLAYGKHPYRKALYRVKDGSIQPGDVLVYEFPMKELKKEQKSQGTFRAGHVMIVASANHRIVVGSHGDASTPPGAVPGVGYRKLLKGWDQWTEGRTLKAVYRAKPVPQKKS